MVMATTTEIIVHPLAGMPVGQRAKDGYINATAMCQAAGKFWGNYRQMQATQDFLDELAGSIGIPIDLLVHTIKRGPNEKRGTWIHPLVAINLAQWCSPGFAVQVAKWITEWYLTGKNPFANIPFHGVALSEQLQKAISSSYHEFLARINGNFAHANADLCKAHSDWQWYPSQLVTYGKRQGWPYKDRCSGLAVLRRRERYSAGAITFEKVMLMSGAKPHAARDMAQDAKKLFQKMLAAGVTCAEIEAGYEDDDTEESTGRVTQDE